jgi:hypothetical protein
MPDEIFWLVLRYGEDIDRTFPVGIFTTQETATHLIQELMEVFESDEFELIELSPNTAYLQDKEEINEIVSLTVESLVKNGMVDYKIGEDGNFYYENSR